MRHWNETWEAPWRAREGQSEAGGGEARTRSANNTENKNRSHWLCACAQTIAVPNAIKVAMVTSRHDGRLYHVGPKKKRHENLPSS